jgi:uncharacterized glyoxalase superfamily protein PhnB
MQRIVPYLGSADAAAAITWLSQAFGFTGQLRYTESDGTVSHAELELSGDAVLLSSGGAGTSDALVLVDVDDVEAHWARARRAGAEVLTGLEETPYGLRRDRARDLEGNIWMFVQRIPDVAPAAWGATVPERRA